MAGMGLRADATRSADAIVQLLSLTQLSWTIEELAAIISMTPGNLRRVMTRLCGIGVVRQLGTQPRRFSTASRVAR